ncbi:unnamed protein product [Symbiodinium natans]|uniref:VWFD domain-containing protein n=1 Tax=Symbiodinium natans TaxID=878477 RepID=A0A812IXW3_9DINO|nr:unnamed protein product [Symbiodinium natans]
MAHRTSSMIWQAWQAMAILVSLANLAHLARADGDCSKCSSIADWNDKHFESCNCWGDPHVSDSWSVNGRFDFHGLGVYRYAHIDACGGGFKMDAFQCQHRDWKHAAVLFVGIELNNGAQVFVNGTQVSTTGKVSVTGTTGDGDLLQMSNPRDGVNIMSDDSCIRINVNAVNLHGDLHYSNGFKVRVPQDAINDKGICGAAKQWKEHVVRGEGDFIFSIEQWRFMCGMCSALGGLHPLNCPSPYFGQFDASPGGEFLRPFEKENERECVSLHEGDTIDKLQANGQNSVVYAILEKSMSCADFCHDRKSQCVDVRDNQDFAPCSFTDGPSKADCDSTEYYDLNCVCMKPDRSAPGPDRRYVCDDKVDAAGNAFHVEDAVKLCKAKAPFLHRAEWDRQGCKNDDECRIDFILGSCVSDVCNAEPKNRVALAKNAGDQDPRRAPNESAERCVADRLGRELCHELTPDADSCSWNVEGVMQEKAEFCEDHICEDTALLQRFSASQTVTSKDALKCQSDVLCAHESANFT